MATPTRFTSGFTQDGKYQPFGNMGIPDPFFYAYFDDDFLPYNPANYTVTAASGSVAATPGDGGRLLFTTGATSGNFASIQLPAASFTITVGKKLAFFTRIQLADALGPSGIAGFIQTTANPNIVTDGIYLSKATGTTNIVLTIVTGSVTIGTLTIPGPTPMGIDFDAGFVMDRLGNIDIYAGRFLIGQQRQDFATLNPVAKFYASNLTGTYTTANLNPTLFITTNSAAAKTLNADFLFAGKER